MVSIHFCTWGRDILLYLLEGEVTDGCFVESLFFSDDDGMLFEEDWLKAATLFFEPEMLAW